MIQLFCRKQQLLGNATKLQIHLQARCIVGQRQALPAAWGQRRETCQLCLRLVGNFFGNIFRQCFTFGPGPENVPEQSSPPRPPSASSLDSPEQVCSPNCYLENKEKERPSTHHLPLLVQLSLPVPTLIVAGGGQDLEEEEQKVPSAGQHLANRILLDPDLSCSPPILGVFLRFPCVYIASKFDAKPTRDRVEVTDVWIIKISFSFQRIWRSPQSNGNWTKSKYSYIKKASQKSNSPRCTVTLDFCIHVSHSGLNLFFCKLQTDRVRPQVT